MGINKATWNVVNGIVAVKKRFEPPSFRILWQYYKRNDTKNFPKPLRSSSSHTAT